MPRKIHAFLILVLLLAVFVRPGLAAAADDPQARQQPPGEPKERLSETTHEAQIGGTEVSYKALAGELLLRDEAEKPQALMFYVAYLAQGAQQAQGARPAQRPITFLFNGGPGSSAVWLHLGAFGPKRVRIDEMGVPGPPPYALADNPDSLLDLTDLVFVDPVSTGYSRTVPGVKAEPFHEVHKDVETMADFIRRFLTRQARWDSPIFILGESYGTIRGAGVVDLLLRRYGIYCNGLALISPALNEMAFQPVGGNDLPYLVDVPSFAATAWYHHRLEPALQQRSLEDVMREASAFALGPYAHALLLGAELPAEERRTTLAQLARLIALPPEELDRRDLRIGNFDYAGELLKTDRLRIGILDSRYKGFPNSLATEGFSPIYQYSLFDPSNTAVNGVFTSALQQYLSRDLHYESEMSYELLALPVAQSWDYGRVTNRYLYAADNLRSALSANPDLQVFMANGQYDLVTTTLATRHIVDHLGIDPRLRDNITVAAYPAGHMMYMHQPSLDKLKQDLARFYQTALERQRMSPLMKPRGGQEGRSTQ